MLGSVRWLFDHIRHIHSPEDWSRDHITRYNLVQCPMCSHWFIRLNQHLPKCKSRSTTVSSSSQGSLHQSTSSSVSHISEHPGTLTGHRDVTPVPTIPDVPTSCGPNTSSQPCRPMDRESIGWSFIQSISTEELLKSLPPRTVQSIPSKLKSLFQDCCSIPLSQLALDSSDVKAWKLLLLIPKMILTPLGRSGKSHTSGIKARYKLFLEYRWEELLQIWQLSSETVNVKQVNNQRHARQSAIRLVKSGELSRAARILTSKGLAPASDETVAKLSLKHPTRDPNTPVPHSDTCNSMALPASVIINVIKKSPRGSGAGPSGWKFEHLRNLLDNAVTQDALVRVLSSIAEGNLPSLVTTWLSASRLIALPKSSGDVRPIAIGEVLRRVSAKAICHHLKSEFSAYFAPLQHGVSTPGGSELVTHHIQLLLESRPDWVLVKTDIKNAFNTIKRSSLHKEVLSKFPAILAHFEQMYGNSSPLVYVKGKETVIISSEEGVHQGDPLGPVLFALGIHPTITKIQADYPEIVVLAYLDDIFLLGNEGPVLDSFANLKLSLAEESGLLIADQKCQIYSPGSTEILAPFPRAVEGSVLLGTPIGRFDFVASQCIEFAKSGSLLCQEIVSLDDPQSSMLLLRHCHTTRMNHLTRTVPPSLLKPAATIHDSITHASFSHIIGVTNTSEAQWSQAILPIRKGGFGMTSVEKISPASFLAGWVHSSAILPKRFSYIWESSQSILDNLGATGQNLKDAKQHIDSLLAGTPSTLGGVCFTDLTDQPIKLQHRITDELSTTSLQHLLDQSQDQHQAARLRSIQGPGCGSWLEAAPSSDRLAFKPSEFRLAALLRLGCPMPFKSLAPICECGKEADDYGYHFLTCKHGGGPVWQHDSVVAGWCECLKEVGLHHRKEVRDRYTNNSNRPDIVVFDAGDGSNIDLDISLSHPWSCEAFPRSSSESGCAASRREEKKKVKYLKDLLPGGSTPNFAPLVFEHFGHWGNTATDYLNTLSLRSRDSDGKCNKAEFRSYWRKKLSVILQRCNAKVLLKKIDRLHLQSSSADIALDCELQSSIH